MNVLQQDKSVIGDPFHTWHKKKISSAPLARYVYFNMTELLISPLYKLNIKSCYFVTHHAYILLEIVERVSSFANPVAVRVDIHLEDYKVEGANVLESTRTKSKRALINRSQETKVRQAIMIMLDI